MCGTFPNIKVVERNEFSLLLPLKKRTFESCKPIDTDIDATQLTDVVVKFGGVEYTPSLGLDGVTIVIPGTIALGTYDLVLTAKYEGSDIRAAYEGAVTIVSWNSQSDAQQFVAGSPIVMDAAYVIGGTLTDEELEELKEEYRDKIEDLDEAIAAAEDAKEDWEEKAEALDGIAQQGTNANATLTETQAQATSAATDAAAAKNGVVDGNDTAVGVAKEVRSELGTGSDTASETGTLFAVVKWAKDKIKDVYTALTDGTNGLAAIKSEATAAKTAAQGAETTAQGTANKNEILAAITANAGVPTMTIPATTAAQELAPNTLYVFAERTTNLTLTLGEPIVGKANEYHFIISTGATAPTINWPTFVVGSDTYLLSWNGGSAPTIAANKVYEVSILNGKAAFMELDPNTLQS